MGTKGGAEVMLVPSPKPQEEHVFFEKKMRTMKASFGVITIKHRGIKETASNGPKKLNTCSDFVDLLQ